MQECPICLQIVERGVVWDCAEHGCRAVFHTSCGDSMRRRGLGRCPACMRDVIQLMPLHVFLQDSVWKLMRGHQLLLDKVQKFDKHRAAQEALSTQLGELQAAQAEMSVAMSNLVKTHHWSRRRRIDSPVSRW